MLAGGLIALAASAAGDGAVTIQRFEHAMRGGDANAEVSRLIRCDDEAERGSSVCDRIAGGEKPWLQLGVRLLAYTDASAHGAICHSMALAMRRAPDDVLAMLHKTPEATEKCLCVPFVSNEVALSEQLSQYRLAHDAVAAARSPTNAAARNACLAFIEPDLEALKREVGEAARR